MKRSARKQILPGHALIHIDALMEAVIAFGSAKQACGYETGEERRASEASAQQQFQAILDMVYPSVAATRKQAAG